MSGAIGPPVRTVSTDTLTSCLSKGKKRVDSRVSFAPDTLLEHGDIDEETAALLSHSRTKYIYGRDDDGHTYGYDRDDSDEEEEDEDESFPSRLNRKLKKRLALAGSVLRKPGTGLPYYAGEDTEYSGTSKVLLYAVSILIFVAVCVGAGILVESNDHYPTGPFPRPPRRPSHDQFPIPPLPSGLPRNPAFLVKGRNGAVAAEHKDCSIIGIDMLKAGGSAADAAVASTLCVGTVNMFSSGIGGGGFMTIRIPPASPSQNSTVWTIDFREVAPSGANATMFGVGDPDASKFGGLSVAIPGELKGLYELHHRWGNLPWEKVVMPSVQIAKGWRVGKELARRLQIYGAFILDDPDWVPIFAPNGKLLKEGELIKRTKYSQTLHTIAIQGVDAFYSPTSPIAQSIVRKVIATGGILTLEDLESYEIKLEGAVQGTYRDRKVWTTGPPTSGAALLHMLNLLEPYDLAKEGRTPLNMHRVVEALKFGFAARTRLGDTLTLKDQRRMADIPTKEYARPMMNKFHDDKTHTPEYYDPLFDVLEDHGTTHVSVVDKHGMAVALTSSVNYIFGSRVMDPETGVILNDEMDDFSRPGIPNVFGLWPSPFNYVAPGKRPLSSIAPTIIEESDGSLHSVLGGSGGSRIFGSILQVILNMDWGMDISQAIEAPRVHDQLFPAFVSAESVVSDEEIEALRVRGHNITIFDVNLGVAEVQGVAVARDGLITAASDSRKNGVAASY